MVKKKSVFLGNCHNLGIITYLNKSEEFRELYSVEYYTNWELLKYKINPPVESIKNCDLFIFQPLSAVYGCYSTYPDVPDSIGSFVKDDCIKISYPYTYFSAFWPIVQSEQNKNRWLGWRPIHKLKTENLSDKDILNRYNKNSIDWEYEKRFEETISILKEKEKYTDISISNFIVDRIKSERLFLIPQHPTSIIFLEIANQILKKLNMSELSVSSIISENESNMLDSTYNRVDCKFPVHKSVIDFYQVNFTKEDSDSHDFYLNKIMDYLKMNHGNKTPEETITRDWEYKI
jgi:hypothetical protein